MKLYHMFSILVLFVLGGLLQAATPYIITDGKIVYPAATVNGVLAWTTTDEANLVTQFQALKGTSAVIVTNIPVFPSALEISISTNIAAIQDQGQLQTKTNFRPLLLKYKANYDLCMDLNDKPCMDDTGSKYRALMQYYNTLP